MDTLYADALTPAEAHAIATLLYKVWPQSTRSFEERLERVASDWIGYRGPDSVRPRYFVIWEAPLPHASSPWQQPVAIASALAAPRTIRTTGGELTILALARVCTAPERRGEGLGARVVRAAFQMVDQGVFPFALFQTTPGVHAFYEKLGACVVTNKIINSRGDDPHACPFWSEVILRYPSEADWPAGTIDLLGPGY
jgi:GNAT superfamily N-acetyltransferase